jgi:hypothetical protein
MIDPNGDKDFIRAQCRAEEEQFFMRQFVWLLGISFGLVLITKALGW